MYKNEPVAVDVADEIDQVLPNHHLRRLLVGLHGNHQVVHRDVAVAGQHFYRAKSHVLKSVRSRTCYPLILPYLYSELAVKQDFQFDFFVDLDPMVPFVYQCQVQPSKPHIRNPFVC